MASVTARLKSWARALKMQVIVLYLVMRHPQTPWFARVWIALVVAYAASPVDLIPDFVPVLGYLDDMLLLPLGILLALRLIPDHVLRECQAQVTEDTRIPPGLKRFGLLMMACLWLLFVLFVVDKVL